MGGADAVEEGGGGFVVAAFGGGEGVFGGDELAAKGLGEDRLSEAIDLPAGRLVAGFDLIGDGEEGVDAADDFLLFGERWNRHRNFVHVRLC